MRTVKSICTLILATLLCAAACPAMAEATVPMAFEKTGDERRIQDTDGEES